MKPCRNYFQKHVGGEQFVKELKKECRSVIDTSVVKTLT